MGREKRREKIKAMHRDRGASWEGRIRSERSGMETVRVTEKTKGNKCGRCTETEGSLGKGEERSGMEGIKIETFLLNQVS